MTVMEDTELKFSPSPAQWRAIFCRPHYEYPMGVTREALIRHGVMEIVDGERHYTRAGREWVRKRLDRAVVRLENENPGVRKITNDTDLMELLVQPDVDIYVYRGTFGLVVRNGNGQNPLAVLHPFYQWEIEGERTAGKFLTYIQVIGHKGSYSYGLKSNPRS